MKDSFFTINKPSKGLYKDKGSKFISLAFPVVSETEIINIIHSVQKEYHGARHHCFAWKLGLTGNTYRINDNGEPSGTAGKPILGQINSKQLTDILIVVIRYFGGILLGTGGLTQAYKKAAADALENAEIVIKYVLVVFYLTFSYQNMNQVLRIIEDCNGEQFDRHFSERCEMKVRVRKSFAPKFIEALGRVEGVELIRMDTNSDPPPTPPAEAGQALP